MWNLVSHTIFRCPVSMHKNINHDPKKYIGRAKEQTERFVNTVVQPILDSHKELLGVKAEINV